MSRFDLTLTKKELFKVDEVHKDFINLNDTSLYQRDIDSSSQMDADLQDWLEIFEEDQVVMYGCR